MLNILFLYNATQTFTNTVYEHIASFAKYSSHRCFFTHQDISTQFNLDLSRFDAVAVHYSIRLPYDQFSPSTVEALAAFKGLKFLFIQDEYDHTHRAWHWIKTLGMQLVFTVVPDKGIETVYPAAEFPQTQFISNLTGYVPDDLHKDPRVTQPSTRELVVGYRGRPLPIRYGQLGVEKIQVGQVVRAYCRKNDIKNDIAWSEESRIYGPYWYEFMSSCRSMLGTESGSNVFDWDGTLVKKIAEYRRSHPAATDEEVESIFVADKEIEGIMNQISPRAFESIAAKTVMVLYEGDYSGVIKPGIHYIALKKDGSNLPDVFKQLEDGAFVDAMAERAYQDVIASGQYSYAKFVEKIDQAVTARYAQVCPKRVAETRTGREIKGMGVQTTTTEPLRATPPITLAPSVPWTKRAAHRIANTPRNVVYGVWNKIPDQQRDYLKPKLKRLLRKGEE